VPFKARAEPSRLRQMWLATLLSQAPGDAMASRRTPAVRSDRRTLLAVKSGL
jgi:hypothetical protein